MVTIDEVAWYPLRVTYSQEMKVKEYLDKEHIENFIPMHYVEKECQGRKTRQLVPVVHNLLFVHICRKKLDELKHHSILSSKIRYIMDNMCHVPIVVPDKQMEDFITVAGAPDEQIMYLTPSEIRLKKGERVRINGGIWKGVVGKLVRIKRGLRVVVAIEGIAAVATASLHPSLVDLIESGENSYG